MQVKQLNMAVTVLMLLAGVQAGCTADRVTHLKETPAKPVSTSILAGTWEYLDDGVVYPITLDENGNGTYAWKDGTFETTSFSGGVWRGKWVQKENDREGGFEVRLSEDYSSGDGRWWYTRIGQDSSPGEPGGDFFMSRSNPDSQGEYAPDWPP